MNLVSRQIYGNKKGGIPNTFIGGVASTINTPALLATKLGINVSRITVFSVVGSDIKCSVSGNYTMSGTAFTNNLQITYYIDNGICNSFDSRSFAGAEKLQFIELPNVTSISCTEGFVRNYKLERIYTPLCTSYGSTVGNNTLFNGSTAFAQGCKIYTHSSMATVNSGGVEGDLQAGATYGAIIRYVTNFTSPNPITTLSAGTIYNTAIQLNFTPPSSTNAIDYYEVYINGVFSKNITASGQLITGLTASTSYSITVIAVDIFLNKSTVSNTLTQLTDNYSYTDTDANAYISAASLTSSEQESAYKLIVDLKSNSLYTKCQAIYPFKGTTASQHKFNAKNPLDTNAAFRLTFTGASTFSNLGYQLNGSSFGNTNLIPSAVLNVNSHGLTIIVGTNNSANSANVAEIGSYNGESQALSFTSKNNNTLFTRRAYVNTIINSTGTNRANGIFSAVKSTASVSKIYENSAVLLSSSGGGSLPTNSIYIGAVNAGGGASYSNQRIQMAIIHEGLSDAEVVLLHAVIDLSETIAGRKTW